MARRVKNKDFELFKKKQSTMERYKNFVLYDPPIKFKEMELRDQPIIQLHSISFIDNRYFKGILGFCGVIKVTDGKIESLDGDTYNENMTVYGYNWWTDKNGRKGLDILVGDDW